MEKAVCELFNRYIQWLKSNKFEDTIYNYMFYLEKIENIKYSYNSN